MATAWLRLRRAVASNSATTTHSRTRERAAEILLAAMRETGLDVPGLVRRVRQPIAQVSREGRSDGPLWGEVVVFTGTLSSMSRTQAAELAAALGCSVRNAVTKQTTMLVVGQQDPSRLLGYSKSTKQRTAERLISEGAEITIPSEADFRRLARSPRGWRLRVSARPSRTDPPAHSRPTGPRPRGRSATPGYWVESSCPLPRKR